MWPNLEVIGFYSAKSNAMSSESGDQPTEHDLQILTKDMLELCDNPIMLIMNTNSQYSIERKTMPFFLYEKGASQPDGKQVSPFKSLLFSMASEASEQIAVDNVAKAVDPKAKTSALSQHMAAPINAIKILRSKLNFLI